MSLEKIKTREELAPLVAQMRAKGLRVGLTNGVFDILHAGHVEYLEAARARCDSLIVSLNTDDSVRLYKDPSRPLVGESDRARVVAALACVDYVTFHGERRMRTTLEILRPTYYIKGGDYTPDKLTSRDVVEQYGGEALILPLKPGLSTTEIINRAAAACGVKPSSCEIMPPAPAPAVYLDRDGVINADHGYISDPAQFELLPGALEGLKRFQDSGFFLIVTTNQGGIGLGYYTREDFYRVNLEMLKQLSKAGIIIHKIYFCPHSMAEECPDRKPAPGMLLRGARELPVIMEKSVMIGDKKTDIAAGKTAGIRTCLITGDPSANTCGADWTAQNLLEAAEQIIHK